MSPALPDPTILPTAWRAGGPADPLLQYTWLLAAYLSESTQAVGVGSAACHVVMAGMDTALR
jgi:hypothetical protein